MNILIFRRELRIQDNTAFNFLVKNNLAITPIFIYDPRQIDKKNNPYFSDKSVQFMDESGKSYFAPRQRGAIVLFDSRTQHRVLKVTKGVRRSLVGWVVGPRWK